MKTLGKYILDEQGNPVEETNLFKWAEWFETAERQVAKTTLATLDGEILISTVFLGLDHDFGMTGIPVLYETMIFGGPLNNEMVRTPTKTKAKEAHKYMVELARAGKL
jgi:hypothetical protein